MELRWDVLIGVLLYIILLSTIIGIVIYRRDRGKSGDSFLYGDKGLGPWFAGVSMGVACIGGLHCAGLMEIASAMGAVAIWLTATTAMLFVVLGTFLAPIYRRMGFNTIPEIFSNLFDHKTRVVASIVGLYFCFNLLSLETQGGGLIIHAITGINIQTCLFVFMLCAFIYMMISGMWQVAYLNIVNTAVMYLGVIIAMIIVTSKLPAGWAGVDAFITSQGVDKVFRFWSPEAGLLLGFGVAMCIGQMFTNLTDQGLLQFVLTAKDADTAKKASFIALLVNSPFTFFTLSFGLAAWSIPQFFNLEGGAKVAGFAMLMTYLPTFVVILVLAAFLIAIISTWARCTMGISQIIINDIYMLVSKNENKDKSVPMLTRVLVFIVGLLAIIPAFVLPNLLLQSVFVFSLGMGLFGMLIIGLFWKRSANAAFTTILITLIGSTIWEYTGLAGAIGAPPWFGTSYLNLVIVLVFGLGLTAILPGKQGYLAEKKLAEAAGA